jgi:RNA polymerase sigma factor (sigma-70 family)
MALGTLINVLPRLREATFPAHNAASDAELLERFISQRDEIAFEVLLRRHGPMVFAVCLRVLHHRQDAEDAFQATFLVLAHKASSVSPRSKLAGWLHGVAHKTALKARYRAIHRSEVEKRVPARSPDEMHLDTNSNEVEAALDQEITGLPDRYRLPIILCDLEGRLRAEVAGILRCSEGTLSSRLTRGRRLLAERLNRRGFGPGVAAIALILSSRSSALTESLILDTVPVVLSSLANPAVVGGAASPKVAQLATGVMKSMFLNKLRTAAVGAFAIAALVIAALGSYTSHAAPLPATAPVPAADAKAAPEIAIDINGHLLMNRKVLKDMKCDIDQLDKIMDILEEAEQKAQLKTNEAMQQLFVNPNGGPINPQNIQKMMQDAQEAGEKEYKKAVEGVVSSKLTGPQRKRLREIDLQVRGFEAFQIPAVAKSLDLTTKQKDELEKIASRVKDEIAKALPQVGFGGGGFGGVGGGAGGPGVQPRIMPAPPGGGRPGAGGFGGGGFGGFNSPQIDKAIEEARAKGLKEAVGLLTDDQKATWKQLVGEPITFPIKNLNRGMSGFQMGGMGFGVPGLPGLPGPGATPLPRPGATPIVPPPVKPGS